MDFSLSSEQNALRDSVARYCREHYGAQARRAILQSAEGHSDLHWASFAQLGWLGAALPEEVGGSCGSIIEAAIILEEFGRALVFEPFLPCAVLAAQVIYHATEPVRCQALLEPMIQGRSQFALAHSEPHSNHTEHAFDTTAQTALHPGFVLNGLKTMVLNGNRAHRFIVSARIGGAAGDHSNVGLFLVERTTPGLSTRTYRTLDGSGAADLCFTNVQVSANALLNEGAAAREALDRALDLATLGICFEAIGAMSTVISTTTSYLKTRRAYGTTLSTFQALQHRLADMLVEVEMSRSILFRALAAFAREDRQQQRLAVSAAKALTGRAGKFVSAHGIQLHGAMGMVDDYIVGQLFKRLTVVEGMFGDSDFHLQRCFQP